MRTWFAVAVLVAGLGGATACAGAKKTLEGRVAGEAERRQAEKVAFDAGALQVDDKLTIDPSAGDAGPC